ncbi:MAG: class II aldolase/adducin family protein [Leptospirales bacterium]|nr:class II aldolase/adducin family protein [Leptospirales bacterium]
MDKLVSKYSDKLTAIGVCSRGEPLFGVIDDEIIWDSIRPESAPLDTVIRGLNINSILFSQIAEPYKSIIDYLAKGALNADGCIKPDDTETRTFLHDIPVVSDFSPEHIINALKKRKGVIIYKRGIVTYGVVSPEQAFIFFCAICFSCYVKFMTDYYYYKKGLLSMDQDADEICKLAVSLYKESLRTISFSPKIKAPFNTSGDVIAAIIEAGRLTVESRMVDSFFGNISVKYNDKIYISQTGSSLDELAGAIDPCPLDNSTSNAITSSSEFSAHRGVYDVTDKKSILHGHPKYSVILSMLCDDIQCRHRGSCHIKCDRKRFINDIPIISGEVGTGPTGISNTLPKAIAGRGAIVYGHGLFTLGAEDFTDAFKSLIDIEISCFERYVELVEM